MEQTENPYASPKTSVSDTPAEQLESQPPVERSRFLSFSFLFLALDAALSVLMVPIGIAILQSASTNSPANDWLLNSALYLLASSLGLVAFVLMIGRERQGMALAFVAGLCGVLVPLAALSGGNSQPSNMQNLWTSTLVLRIGWNVAFIFAARSFARK